MLKNFYDDVRWKFITMRCRVCHSKNTEIFTEIDSKTYWECLNCFAKFLDKSHFLSKDQEYAHYCTHQNKIYDPDYRRFLSKLSIPLKRYLMAHSEGLDYGCGPGPALSVMLEEDGYKMCKYDPFFFPDKKIFLKQFDFVTCSETAEHFHNPNYEFKIIDKMLKPSGVLGIMTSFLTKELVFENWFYNKDPTHVVFYSPATFEIIAKQRGWRIQFIDVNIVIFKK